MSEPTYKQPGDEYFRREIARLTAENDRLRAALADMIEIANRNSSPEIILTAIRMCAGHALAQTPEEGI